MAAFVNAASLPSSSNVHQSRNRASATTRRAPSANSLQARPTSEFGWQLALQNVRLTPFSDQVAPIEEDPQWREEPANQVSHSQITGDGSDVERKASSIKPVQTEIIEVVQEEFDPQAQAESSKFSRRYANKDIGWQLVLQQSETAEAIEEQAIEEDYMIVEEPAIEQEHMVIDEGIYAQISRAKNHTPQRRRSPNPTYDAPSYVNDSFNPWNLELAAQALPTFAVENSSGSWKKNNPFAAAASSAAVSSNSSGALINLEYNEPPPLPRKDEWKNKEDGPNELFHCQYCLNSVPVTDLAQVPSCDHIFCRTCLQQHVEDELLESRFPILCPLCDASSTNPGAITAELVEHLDLDHADLNKFREYQLSAHSTRLFCPKCQETMLVDREQYQEENIINCPLRGCRHKWCKLCLKEMPLTGDTKHKCKPDKKSGFRLCPGCGTPEQKIATNNHLKCKGLGCKMHFCFKCGRTIVDESTAGDVAAAVATHYKSCVQYQKPEKCTIQ